MPTVNTLRTYDNSVIREDLEQQYSMISPEETPFQTAIGVGSPCSMTNPEWTVVDLQEPVNNNRVSEGDPTPPDDAPTLAERLSNYTQISDKIVRVSHTSEAVDAAAENIQRLAEQMALKLRELKRDMEVMLLSNVAANPGSGGVGGTARVAAGLPAFLRTNIILGATGAAPTLSGTDNGYPDAPATPGTPIALTELSLNNLIEQCWNSGAVPTIIMVNSNNKRIISQTFTGNSTRYKDAIDKRLVASIDVYDSDFGELTVVPNRFQPTVAADTYAMYILDPDFAELKFLEAPRQKPLAETGHAKRRLLWAEYTLKVHNEAAHGVHFATNGVMPSP